VCPFYLAYQSILLINNEDSMDRQVEQGMITCIGLANNIELVRFIGCVSAPMSLKLKNAIKTTR
jgi:hypothetical protein